jgi:hypothetical protein
MKFDSGHQDAITAMPQMAMNEKVAGSLLGEAKSGTEP